MRKWSFRHMETGLGVAVSTNDRTLAMKLACEETTSSLSFHSKCLVPSPQISIRLGFNDTRHAPAGVPILIYQFRPVRYMGAATGP